MALNWKSFQLLSRGYYSEAYSCLLQALEIEENPSNSGGNWPINDGLASNQAVLYNMVYTHMDLGHLAGMTENRREQLMQYFKAQELVEQLRDTTIKMFLNIASAYLALSQPDSALFFLAKQTSKSGYGTRLTGNVYMMKGNLSLALEKYYAALRKGKDVGDLSSVSRTNFALAKYFLQVKQKDSSLHYAYLARNGIDEVGLSNSDYNMGVAYENLFRSYELNNKPDSTFKYMRLAMLAKDSLNKQKIRSLSQLQNLSMREQVRLQNLEKEKALYESKLRTNTLLGSLLTLSIVALFFYFNSRQKQKAKQKIEQAYDQLKSTQSQLIQSEKMASLGELTAGIAHEIQNPLNFVNNFSEVSNELIDEMKAEMATGNQQLATEIANDVKQNLEKILHHGKRADAIVKGMLQHSRSSNGIKGPTDINALCDEYLRLSYHGLRAKDKSFNAKFETDFDSSLPKINVVPQDIGRVILNLINNAFYACTERSRSVVALRHTPAPTSSGKGDDSYQPTVWVSTQNLNDKILITVKDNGNGIPKNIVDKIFQPFFTTKPTGQGTGLGLSLSYDIVKAHGGELKVETKEGEGSEFIIHLTSIVVQ